MVLCATLSHLQGHQGTTKLLSFFPLTGLCRTVPAVVAEVARCASCSGRHASFASARGLGVRGKFTERSIRNFWWVVLHLAPSEPPGAVRALTVFALIIRCRPPVSRPFWPGAGGQYHREVDSPQKVAPVASRQGKRPCVNYKSATQHQKL